MTTKECLDWFDGRGLLVDYFFYFIIFTERGCVIYYQKRVKDLKDSIVFY